MPSADDALSPSGPLGTIDREVIRLFALVGESVAGATHALLAGDREMAKHLVKQDEVIDQLYRTIEGQAQELILARRMGEDELRYLLAVLRMLPHLERSGDLAEHIARRAARGLGVEMSPRSRGLVERMGEVAARIWCATADAYVERPGDAARMMGDLDDEMDDLHVSLTAEVVSGTMPLPVAIEVAMVARFYERFGDHAVNLARRVTRLGPAFGPSSVDG